MERPSENLVYIVNSNKKIPYIVIPAQAGIQGVGFQALIGKGCDATVWTPACAGMTI